MSPNRKWYLFNGHGDVVQLTGTDGNVTKTYDYDAFGNEKDPDPNDTNVFRYCGEYFDKETGTIYLRARYYDPATSRMLTEDSYWGDIRDPLSLNLYTYCGNDPINRIDPSGNNWIDAVAGWAKSVDDSIFFGAGGWLGNKIRGLFGAQENDWDYLKGNNEDFALTYKAGSYANAIYGVVNLAGGLKKIITSGGEAIVNNSGEIVQMVSGTAEGVIQAAKGAGITLMSAGNANSSGGNNLLNQTKEQLQKSKKSYEDLLKEHRQKLDEYIKDPYSGDNQGLLKNAPNEQIKQQIINNRIKVLKNQINKHQGELDKINQLLKELGN